MTEWQINMIKEYGFEYDVKMDAVNLMGVWPTFPKVSTGHGHVYAAGILLAMMEDDYRRRAKKVETAEQRRHRLLRDVEDRLEREDQDDLLTILSL